MIYRLALLVLTLSFLPLFGEGIVPPLVKVEAKVLPAAFDGSKALDPMVISTQEDVEKVFAKEGVAALMKQVNLEEQVVVLFAWRGSGHDRMEAQIAESFPEQVTFLYSPGLTRDLRSHVQVYALRKNVKWSVKAAPSRGFR